MVCDPVAWDCQSFWANFRAKTSRRLHEPKSVRRLQNYILFDSWRSGSSLARWFPTLTAPDRRRVSLVFSLGDENDGNVLAYADASG